ncbi:MAG TPA: hypothetical protein VF531_08770 [Bacillota bacterium]
MKPTLAKGSIVGGCLILLWISMASFISAVSYNDTPEFTSAFRTWLPTASAAMAQVMNWLDYSQPLRDYSGDIALHANSANPSTNFSLIGKRIPPLWGRPLATKSVPVTLGFFIPAMVLLLFCIFYQSSRTSSDSNPD